MSATTLPVIGGKFNSYAAYVEQLLTGRVEPAVAAQVVAVVAGLEETRHAVHRDADAAQEPAVGDARRRGGGGRPVGPAGRGRPA